MQTERKMENEAKKKSTLIFWRARNMKIRWNEKKLGMMKIGWTEDFLDKW